MSGPPQMDRRVKAVVAARRSTELDGSRSTTSEFELHPFAEPAPNGDLRKRLPRPRSAVTMLW